MARETRRIRRIFWQIVLTVFFRLPHLLIVSKEDMKNYLINVYLIGDGRIKVLPMGVRRPNRPPDPSKLRDKLGLLTTDKVFYSPSFLRQGLLLEELIETLKTLPDDFKLIINGATLSSGDQHRIFYLPKIKELIYTHNLGSRVFVLEPSDVESDENYLNSLAAADVLVFLHQPYDSLDSSLSILNAVALKKPIMVSQTPKFSDFTKILNDNDLGKLIIGPTDSRPTNRETIREAFSLSLNEEVKEKLRRVFQKEGEGRPWEKANLSLVEIYKMYGRET